MAYIYTYYIITFVVYNIHDNIIYRNNGAYIHIYTHTCVIPLSSGSFGAHTRSFQRRSFYIIYGPVDAPPVKLFLWGGIVIVNRSNTHTHIHIYTFIIYILKQSAIVL